MAHFTWFPVTLTVVWIALAVYILTLISRFVHAVERIADKFEK